MIISIKGSKDPFSLLGIPTLNPSQIFNDDLEIQSSPNSFQSEKNFSGNDGRKKTSILNSIEDLSRFLQTNKLNSEEGTKIVSKFLISDDYLLKNNGAVFDQTGFDGILNLEQIYPLGRPERIIQRARSAAKIFFNKNYKVDKYEAYGAEKINSPNVPKGWEVYKVLLVGKVSANDHFFLKVCIPEDENLTALVSQINKDCVDKVIYLLILD
jgi:hypothetical protein